MIFKKLRNRVMEYKYRLIIYLILLALTLGLAIALQVIAFPIKVLNIKDKATNNIDKCYVMAPNIPYYPESEVQAIVYKPVVNYNPVIKDHEKLIDCLIRYESNGNENAINPCDIDVDLNMAYFNLTQELLKHIAFRDINCQMIFLMEMFKDIVV